MYRLVNNVMIRDFLGSLAARPSSFVASYSCLGVILVGSAALPVVMGERFEPLSAALVCAIFAAVVALAASQRGFIRIGPRALPLVHWGGELSYAIYLSHIPVWFLLNEIIYNLGFGHLSWEVMAPLGLGLTVYAAALTYRFVEMPFNRGIGKRSPPATAGPDRAPDGLRQVALPAPTP